MKLTIRIDDVCPTINVQKLDKMIDILDYYHIEPLLGVVPFNKHQHLICDKADSQFWEKMRRYQQRGYKIALHGCTHLYSSQKGGIFPLNSFSEFAGLTYANQYSKLYRGKKYLSLHGIDTDIFMAPGHTFDFNTIKALIKLDFHFITDGYGIRPYRKINYPITFLPICRNGKVDGKGCASLVYHTNTMTSRMFKEFEKMIVRNRNNFVCYDEFMAMPYEIQDYREAIQEYFMARLDNYKRKKR